MGTAQLEQFLLEFSKACFGAVENALGCERRTESHMIIAVRIPSLDGLRAVSISMVLVGHALFSYHGKHGAEWSYLGNGDLGVSIFFVISGFLITALLLREFE